MDAHQTLDPDLYRLAHNANATYAAFVRQQRIDGRGLLVVADVGGEVMGYTLGCAGRRSPCYAVRDIGMIFDLVVDPTHRRAGIGHALVEAATTRFRGMGLSRLQVNFSPDNVTASQFWPALGFQTLLHEAYRTI